MLSSSALPSETLQGPTLQSPNCNLNVPRGLRKSGARLRAGGFGIARRACTFGFMTITLPREMVPKWVIYQGF